MPLTNFMSADHISINDYCEAFVGDLQGAVSSCKSIRNRIAVAKIGYIGISRYLPSLCSDIMIGGNSIIIAKTFFSKSLCRYFVGCAVDS